MRFLPAFSYFPIPKIRGGGDISEHAHGNRIDIFRNVRRVFHGVIDKSGSVQAAQMRKGGKGQRVIHTHARDSRAETLCRSRRIFKYKRYAIQNRTRGERMYRAVRQTDHRFHTA